MDDDKHLSRNDSPTTYLQVRRHDWRPSPTSPGTRLRPPCRRNRKRSSAEKHFKNTQNISYLIISYYYHIYIKLLRIN